MLPTLNELNDLSCSQVQLLVLRALTTSDLTFNYMLFKPETLKDIVAVSRDLMNSEVEDDESQLSKSELDEFNELANDISEFAEGQLS